MRPLPNSLRNAIESSGTISNGKVTSKHWPGSTRRKLVRADPQASPIPRIEGALTDGRTVWKRLPRRKFDLAMHGPVSNRKPPMKTAAALLVLLVAALNAQASAGPPPFTNGSPLITGVDGSYQATARGKNLTGVFRFTYQNGSQTSSPQLPTGDSVGNLLTDPYNDYVFFVEGLVFRGLVQANINTSSIAGVLDNGSANVAIFGSNAAGLGIEEFTSGFFNGCMDQNSPFASFHGTGEVTVNTKQEVVIREEQVLVEGTGTSVDNPPVFNTVPVTEEVIAPSSVVKFKFRGVRNATGTTSTTTTTSSTTSG
jgi:hypothetical protein